MKSLTRLLGLVAVTVLAACSMVLFAGPASAHRDGCHRWHSCPSDSGSYTCGDTGHYSGCPLPGARTPTTMSQAEYDRLSRDVLGTSSGQATSTPTTRASAAPPASSAATVTKPKNGDSWMWTLGVIGTVLVGGLILSRGPKS